MAQISAAFVECELSNLDFVCEYFLGNFLVFDIEDSSLKGRVSKVFKPNDSEEDDFILFDS